MCDQNRAGFFQGFDEDDPTSQASEDLKGGVITAYEHALAHGVTPSHALAAILHWIAEEYGRIRMDTA